MGGIIFGIEIEALVWPKRECADLEQRFYDEGGMMNNCYQPRNSTCSVEAILGYYNILIKGPSCVGYPAHTKTQGFYISA